MTSNYQLKPDVLLYDTLTLNPTRTLSQANLTDELAIYHLATTWQIDVRAYLQAQQPANQPLRQSVSSINPKKHRHPKHQ